MNGKLSPTLIGTLCGAGAALFWASALVSARHGIAVGLSPLDIVFHRLVWVGLCFLPFIRKGGVADFAGVGWGRCIVITILGGAPFTLLSYAGFLLVPLGHAGVIQPSCGALGGLLLSTLVLKDKLLATRIAGAIGIVLGLITIGYEALSTFGADGVLGDLMFVVAGLMFAGFALSLKLWRVTPLRAVAITSVLSSVLIIPIQLIFVGFDRILAVGLYENLMQVFVQGVLSSLAATVLFTRSVALLGPSRAAMFTTLVPPFTLLLGFVFLGIVPSAIQLLGLVIVLIGLALTQKT